MPTRFARPSRGRAILIAVKLAASSALVLATLGYLWHGIVDVRDWGISDPPSASWPTWLISLAKGWYPAAIDQTANLMHDDLFSAVVYAAACLLVVLAVFSAPFVARRWLRLTVSIILVAGVTYDLALYDVGGGLPSREITRTMLTNIGFGMEGTVSAYLGEILPNLAIGAVALTIFAIAPPPLGRLVDWLATGVVSAALASVVTILWITDGYTTTFPSPVTSYINAASALDLGRSPPAGTVGDLQFSPSPFEKIVLIVDESIRGDYLSLNNPNIGTTPFLLSRADAIANFGIGLAAANCSTEARIALRYGLRATDLGTPLRTLLGKPTLWQFARHANFETIHLDTFGTAITPSNGITATERGYIDERISIRDTPAYTRDDIVAGKLLTLLRADRRAFIVVDKYGAHIPYDRMYPPAANRFGARLDIRFSLRDRDELVRHYKNAIAWSVDHFFERLLTAGLPEKTLVIYTSDHGQSLSETPTRLSHCSDGPVSRGEVIVPLFALGTDPEWQRKLAKGARFGRDKASHFDIAPTLLAAMGYPTRWIEAHYDPPLTGLVPGAIQRRFLAGGRPRSFDDDKVD